MPEYLTPDVYVIEVPAGPRPIEAVGTRTAAFIGEAPKGNAYPGQAVAINNWLQFMREFVAEDSKSTVLANAVFGFFQNGGSRCFIVNVGRRGDIAKGLQALEPEDEVAIVAAPGYTDIASYDAILTHCENMQDRVAIRDSLRGVHKAPANEIIRGALNVQYRLTRDEQATLNPEGVNCIRYFPREGIRIWGARTLAGSASEWRYLNVRRLFNMVEESIAEATRWIVFEPNDRGLWKSIKRDVGAFLTRVWRDGALMGRTAGEAFFVKCDEETNPPDVIDAGMVVTIIGLAPVKPAEFVIFRISQHAGGIEIEAQGGASA